MDGAVNTPVTWYHFRSDMPFEENRENDALQDKRSGGSNERCFFDKIRKARPRRARSLHGNSCRMSKMLPDSTVRTDTDSQKPIFVRHAGERHGSDAIGGRPGSFSS
jgi:hypothetical protein